jgi:outer membrane protein OmpA-like peptidoglycan-associated protein
MPSVFDSVIDALDDRAVKDRLGALLGADPTGVDTMTKAAIPTILGGVSHRLDRADGPAAVAELIGAGSEATAGGLGRFLERDDAEPGLSMLDGLFGSNRTNLVSGLASRAGVGSAAIQRLLPLLAPIALGVVGRIRANDQLDDNQLASLLHGERADLERRGLLAAGPPDSGILGAAGAMEGRTTAKVATGAAAGAGRSAGSRWLLWALPGIAAVAVAAIALSQCGGSDSVANGSATTAAAGASSTAAGGGATTAKATTSTAKAITTVPTTASAAATSTSAAATATTAPAAGSTINDLLKLDPVTFEVSSAVITPAGKAVLDKAAAFFAAEPTVKVEIGGHTDSDGNDASNLTLSQSRADAVKAYLVNAGIAENRMTTKGYGETKPKTANDSPTNKAINRRIEFTVL